MPSVLAIVSKAVFEKDAKIGGRVAGVGDVVPFERYVTKNKGISPVGEGGSLFLVTVRPPDEDLWLVAILESPAFDGDQWNAPKNTVPISDIGTLKDKIKFVSGVGISAKKGALGMSLQTPRVLTDDDVTLLRGSPGAAASASTGARAPLAGAKGHLNAHEASETVPCLCRKCLPAAPDKVTVSGLTMIRDRAEAAGRHLWYWIPESLAGDKEAIRRAVESRLHGRLKEQGARREYDDMDSAFGDGDDE